MQASTRTALSQALLLEGRPRGKEGGAGSCLSCRTDSQNKSQNQDIMTNAVITL